MARRDSEGLGPGARRGVAASCSLAAALFVALLLGACATMGRGTVRERDEFAALSDGAKLYLRVDVDAARTILDAAVTQLPFGVDEKRGRELLDRTDTAAVALFASGGQRRYLVAARGSYPSARAAFSLTLNSGWKKAQAASGERYWRSDSGISLAFNRESAMVSDGEPFGTWTPPSPPEAYSSEAGLISGWLPAPAETISSLLAQTGSAIRLPIEDLVFAVLREEGGTRFILETRLVAVSPERARALASILKLVRTNLAGASHSRGGAFLKTLLSTPPVLDGSSLVLRSSPMTAEEIALLCADVSIYLSQ